MSKSEMMVELARERGWLLKEIKLVNGGPEFEVVPKSPTYEQAIVHMYREAKSIIAQGHKLRDAMLIARHNYFHAHSRLAGDRRMLGAVRQRKTYWHVRYEENVAATTAEVCRHLDFLWEAQEKYNAWAKLYGDI